MWVCKYNDLCLFVHDKKGHDKVPNENQKIFEKIFRMIDEVTKRLIDVENEMWK